MENGLGLEEICVSLFLIRMIEFLNIFEEKSLQTKRLGEMVLPDTLELCLKNHSTGKYNENYVLSYGKSFAINRHFSSACKLEAFSINTFSHTKSISRKRMKYEL